MSEAKWKASVARAGDPVRVATAPSFRERQKSTPIERSSTGTGNSEWCNSTEWKKIRCIASQMIQAQETAINPASPKAERFSILPWP